jgi:hypothetical protein
MSCNTPALSVSEMSPQKRSEIASLVFMAVTETYKLGKIRPITIECALQKIPEYLELEIADQNIIKEIAENQIYSLLLSCDDCDLSMTTNLDDDPDWQEYWESEMRAVGAFKLENPEMFILPRIPIGHARQYFEAKRGTHPQLVERLMNGREMPQ